MNRYLINSDSTWDICKCGTPSVSHFKVWYEARVVVYKFEVRIEMWVSFETRCRVSDHRRTDFPFFSPWVSFFPSFSVFLVKSMVYILHQNCVWSHDCRPEKVCVFISVAFIKTWNEKYSVFLFRCLVIILFYSSFCFHLLQSISSLTPRGKVWNGTFVLISFRPSDLLSLVRGQFFFLQEALHGSVD